MRKFLRLLMLVLMVAYGSAGWGASEKFRAGRNEGNNSKGTIEYPVIDQTSDKSNNFYITCDNDLDVKEGATGKYWPVYKNNHFIIHSRNSDKKIVHIFFSFNSKRSGGSTHGGERFRCSSKGSYDWKDRQSRLAGYSKGYWKCPDSGEGSEGLTEVDFYAAGERCDIFWFRVYFTDVNGSTGSRTLTFTGDSLFTGGTQAGLTATGYTNVYWTADGSDPAVSTNQNRYSGTFSNWIDCSYSCKAVGEYKMKAGDDDSEVDYDNDQFTMRDVKTMHYRKYYDLTTNQYNDYATFCYSGFCWYVPYGVTAWTFNNTSAKKAPCVLSVTQTFNGTNQDYTKNDIIAAGTPVVLKAKANSTYRFYNPDLNVGGKTGASILIGNGSGNTLSDSSFETGYYYYYLMKEKQNGSWGFFWCAPNGAAVDLGPHKAYLRFKKSDAKAKSFIIQMPDDDSTTGIVAIPVYGDPATPRGLDPSAPMYNAAGQRVGASYKGIVIQNGRKFVKR